MNSPKHIVIASGIYPPEIGGPAEYAKNLLETLRLQKYSVSLVTYGELKKLPRGLRHVAYFVRLLRHSLDTDYIIALDTFSALVGAIIGKIRRVKVVVRIGGDFLWESYVERTKEPILLSDFYKESHTQSRKYSPKEEMVFYITRWYVRMVSAIIFTTEWQKQLMYIPYNLTHVPMFIIENFYGQARRETTGETQGKTQERNRDKKVFLSPSRDRYIKNKDALYKAWEKVSAVHSDIFLDTDSVSHEILCEKISHAYAIITPSFSEVSPNLVLDGLSYGVPAVVTHDTGIAGRIASSVIFIDPKSVEDIARGIEKMLDPVVYESHCREALLLGQKFLHSWHSIAQEFIDVYEKLK